MEKFPIHNSNATKSIKIWYNWPYMHITDLSFHCINKLLLIITINIYMYIIDEWAIVRYSFIR